jgi:pyruvate dehydrogenase E2 component (dihydrolipoamide acetyltransferase)
MPTDVVMPKLGLTMEEGTLTTWLVADGATVSAGEPLFALETDKVEAEVEAEADGTLVQAVAEGTTVTPGTVVGRLLAPGEQPDSAAVGGGGRHDGQRERGVSPRARKLAAELGVDLATVAGTGPGGRVTGEDVEAAAAAGSAGSAGAEAPPAEPAGAAEVAPGAAPPLSPVIRRLAAELGVDVATLRGSGPGGRVTRADVLGASPVPPADVHGPDTGAQPAAGGTVPLTAMRRIIASRMHASLQSTAQLTMTRDVDMDRAVALRDELAAWLRPLGEPVPTYTDLVVAAAGAALPGHPELNATLHEDHLEVHARVDIGVAVAVEGGLMVPVVRSVPDLSLRRLAAETARLADAARSGRVALADLEGATFSVTSLGMFGIDTFTPIVNPPNTAILGVGRVRRDVAWTDDDRPLPAWRLTLSLTIDHRAVDGAPGAEFLATVAAGLEHPVRLLAG